MQSFTRTATIDAPPSQVFAALTDLEQMPSIMPDIVRAEAVEEGPFEKGFTWRETRRMKLFGFIPFKGTATIAVDDLVKDKLVRTVADDGCNWAAYTFTLGRADRGKRTDVELLGEFRGTGKYEGSEKVAKRLAKWCEKADGDLLERLKAHVEGSMVQS